MCEGKGVIEHFYSVTMFPVIESVFISTSCLPRTEICIYTLCSYCATFLSELIFHATISRFAWLVVFGGITECEITALLSLCRCLPGRCSQVCGLVMTRIYKRSSSMIKPKSVQEERAAEPLMVYWHIMVVLLNTLWIFCLSDFQGKLWSTFYISSYWIQPKCSSCC